MKRVALAIAVLMSGCTLQTAGAPKGDLHLTATFDDAQHLVAGHAVKVSDVEVGSVSTVALRGYRARVTMSIVNGRRIPAGTVAVLGQTSLLGENYVQLRFPEHFNPLTGPFLARGAEISTTRVDPSLEHVTEQGIEVLAAIQGGDVAAIVNTGATGLGGQGTGLHDIVSQLAEISTALGSQRGDLAGVIDGLGGLGAQLAARSDDIGALLDNLSGATKTVSAQRERIIGAVQGLTILARALNEHVLDPHGRQLQTLLAQLDPIVASLGASTGSIEKLLSGLAVLARNAPHAFNDVSDILLYGWYDSLRQRDGTEIPFGAAAP